MSGTTTRALAALSFALICTSLPASAADDTVRIRGTIERVEGPVYVVRNRDGAELKLTVTENPLFVAIAPSTMADIKAGMFVGSAGRRPESHRGAYLPGIDARHRRGPLRLGSQAKHQDDQRQC
jgi:hypothetical protein